MQTRIVEELIELTEKENFNPQQSAESPIISSNDLIGLTHS